MAILPEMYRWWLNGYVLVTSLMTSQEEDLKDSSSPIIVKSIKHFLPYAYHPVLVLLNVFHNTPEKIQNAVL